MTVAARALSRALPWALARRFDPAAARDLDAVLELRVDGERWALRIHTGRCLVQGGGDSEARAVVALSAGDLARLAAGVASWPQLLSAGRLRLEGDPFLALRFPTLFRLRAAHG